MAGTAGGVRAEGKFAHPVMIPMDDSGKRGIKQPGSFLLEIKGDQLTGRMIGVHGKVLDQFQMIQKEQ